MGLHRSANQRVRYAAHRFDPRAPLWLASAVVAPAMVMVLVSPRYEVLLGMALANGLGTGSLLPAWSALVARCFGAVQFAGVMGLSRLCAYPLIATGGLLAALSKEANFSVGCYCADEARCHRSVLRRLLKERGAKLT